MTYNSNIEALKANATNVANQKINRSESRIKNIESARDEEIQNIKSATELLVGKNPQKQYLSAAGGGPQYQDGTGIIPNVYGERVKKKLKEGNEAAKKDNEERVGRLAELAAHLDSLSEQEKEYHRQKINMLQTGAYYEDADRFAKLSPHAQVGYAQHKIGLYNNTVSAKLQNYLTKSEDELNVNGVKFTPKDVHMDHTFPLLLKEHAVNQGMAHIRHSSGIDGFSEAMLDLGGVNDNPASGKIGSESAAKKKQMDEYRTNHNFDSSNKSQLKYLMEFENSEVKDLNLLVTRLAGTLNLETGKMLSHTGAWNKAEDLIVDSLVHGALGPHAVLSGKDLEDFIYKTLGGQESPIDPSKTILQTHKKRLDRILNNAVKGRDDLIKAQMKNEGQLRDELELDYKKYTTGMRKKHGENWKPHDAINTIYATKYQKLGGMGYPAWLSDQATISTHDDREQIRLISETLSNGGTMSPSDWAGKSDYVKNYFLKPQTEGGQTRAAGYTEQGYLQTQLKKGGFYWNKLNNINKTISGQSGILGTDFTWSNEQLDARRAMEVDFVDRFDHHRSLGVPAAQAAQEALTDVELRSAIDVKGKSGGMEESKYKDSPHFQAQGRAWTGNPMKDSYYYNQPKLSREELYKQGGEVFSGLEWYNKNIFPTGDRTLLSKKRIDNTEQHVAEAVKFFEGKRSTIPSYYQELASKIPGLTDYRLMFQQVQAHYPGINPSQLNPKRLPHPSEALDMSHYNDVARRLGEPTSTCAKLQVKACLVDKRVTADVNPANMEVKSLDETIEDSVTSDTQQQVQTIDGPPEPLPAPEPVHHEPTLQEGDKQTKGGGVRTSIGDLFHTTTHDRFWQGDYNQGDTREISGENQTYVGDGTDKQDWVPTEVVNAYGDVATYLQARENYTKPEYQTPQGINPGLGVSGISGSNIGLTTLTDESASGGAMRSTQPIPGKDFKDLSIEDHQELQGRWFFKSAIPAVYGVEEEQYLRQFPLEMRTQIRNMERKGQWNPETHDIRIEGMNGTVFGIPWELPNIKGPVLVPKQKVSNLQSVMTSPDSPYLANNLREYASQLYVSNVLTEIPVNV